MDRRLARKPPEEPAPEEPEEPEEPEWKPTPLLYNVNDACFILGRISKQMLYRLINLNQITPVKIGTRSLFTMEELQRYVDHQVQERAG